MERDKIMDELKEVEAEIARLKDILASDILLMNFVVEELEDIQERYGDARRTEFIDADPILDYEDLISDDECVVTISHNGYVKRMPVDLFQSQRRGGKGKIGAKLREEDLLSDVFHTTLLSDFLVFTSYGRVYKLKVYQITPSETGRHRGKPIVQMIPVAKDELIRSVLPIRSYDDFDHLFFVTKRGKVKKTPLTEYTSIRSNGKIAISLEHDDDLVRAMPLRAEQHVMLSTKNGLSIRFVESDARPMGRGAKGVRGIRLRPGDEVVGTDTLEDGLTILAVSEKGYGKRTHLDEYRVQNRGGKGIIAIQTTDRNGKVVAALQVTDNDDLILVTDAGQMIRIRAKDIRTIGRNTQGVKLFDVAEGQKIVAVERIEPLDEDENAEGEEGVEVEASDDASSEETENAPEETNEGSENDDDTVDESEDSEPEE
jgi:DNA gyrase subunit A